MSATEFETLSPDQKEKELSHCYTHELLEESLEKIINDVRLGNFNSICELLTMVYAKDLESFIDKETLNELKSKWNIK